MTAETANDLAEAFREHRDAFGVEITFGEAEPIQAIVAEAEFGRELAAGGFAETGDLSCKLLLEDLETAPVLGDPVTYNGRTFKVSSFAKQPGSLVGECNLRPAKR
jgi:hypothetical protein